MPTSSFDPTVDERYECRGGMDVDEMRTGRMADEPVHQR
jgi:hypothetical protein